MLPVDAKALHWLRVIRLTLIARKVRVSETVKYTLDDEGHRLAQRAKPGRPVTATDVNTPEAMITRELARASRVAIRFLRHRGVTQQDRRDILHDAIVWCLEHSNNYSLTTTLETWFINAVRDAYKRFKLHKSRVVYVDNPTLGVVDDGILQVSDD